MHRISIPIRALNRIDLPPICPLTGSRDVEYRAVRFTWYPRWIALFAVPALLVAAVLAAVLTRRAGGEMPFNRKAWWRWKLGQAASGTTIVIAVFALMAFFYALADGRPTMMWVTGLFVLPVPIATYLLLVWRKGPSVVEIRPDVIVLKLPNAEAAAAWEQKLAAGYTGFLPLVAEQIAREAALTMTAPATATCATHPEVAAAWICGRCGSFFCAQCARDPAGSGRPLCVSCATSRADALGSVAVVSNGIGRLQLSGLVLGFIALIPGCWPIVIASLITNGVSLYRTLRLPDRKALHRPVVGFSLTLAGVVLSVWLMVFR